MPYHVTEYKPPRDPMTVREFVRILGVPDDVPLAVPDDVPLVVATTLDVGDDLVGDEQVVIEVDLSYQARLSLDGPRTPAVYLAGDFPAGDYEVES
jgi:hypothetical protein